ncbi:phage tail tip lysozyme [Enterococcus wangshanyuanii]|uniref:phage tail tip lysozyme n=1 Tax=Enterococcus wangshanyuanii TaxID=2005703 RepID=UPI001D037418|nr:phage tail tip lysozyme [Enterococcus wangshanyuanii]
MNGKSPDYELKTIKELETDNKSRYFLSGEDYEHYQEVKKELGYTTLDDPLAFPFETDSLIVSRRYGYEKKDGKESLFQGIELMTEVNKAFNSPLEGKVTTIPNETSLVIEKEKSVRLTIEGVKSSRFKGNEDVQVGTFLGNSPNETVTLQYEKYDLEKKAWFSVNPAFYFPNVTYTQTTLLGSSSFDPGADVESRARAVYDYLTKLGYKKEGIAAILGNFSVESGINPKRAEGDYLNPPVGASATSWDDPAWLAMGGTEIYGKFPNILHRGLGLGQWTDTADGSTRHTLLLDYAKSKKKKWYDLQLQLDFIFNGDSPAYRTIAANTAGNKVAATVPELTVYFLNNWEGNPGDKTSERIQAAQNWFNFLSSSGNEVNGSSSEVFQKYKDKMKPLPTDRETKQGQGWPGNAYALGNCTWYVYNRMAQLGKSIHPTMGNANQWIVNYILTPGASLVSTPRRGDAVIFTNGVAGSKFCIRACGICRIC